MKLYLFLIVALVSVDMNCFVSGDTVSSSGNTIHSSSEDRPQVTNGAGTFIGKVVV